MPQFKSNSSLHDFQELIKEIYGVPDDRLFSLSDLISNLERFTMRSLKGIRKQDKKKLELNLLISLSWLMAIANRLHVNTYEIVLNRFPYVCSYCKRCPCVCKSKKYQRRKKSQQGMITKKMSINDLQEMFQKIYPSTSRSISDAGVHLAEETGELSEACHNFQGEHKSNQFLYINNEIADYVSCIFGVANSMEISVSEGLEKMYKNSCHMCHKSPCQCNFSYIAQFNS